MIESVYSNDNAESNLTVKTSQDAKEYSPDWKNQYF